MGEGHAFVIRPAALCDLPALTAMGERFHARAGLSDIAPFDPASFRQTVAGMIGGDSAFVLVLDDGDPVGMAGCLLYPFWFCRDHLAAQEMFWWVDPQYRGGDDLHAALEREARRRGAQSVSMLCLDGLRDEALARLYRMRGYRPMERSFIKGAWL